MPSFMRTFEGDPHFMEVVCCSNKTCGPVENKFSHGLSFSSRFNVVQVNKKFPQISFGNGVDDDAKLIFPFVSLDELDNVPVSKRLDYLAAIAGPTQAQTSINLSWFPLITTRG